LKPGVYLTVILWIISEKFNLKKSCRNQCQIFSFCGKLFLKIFVENLKKSLKIFSAVEKISTEENPYAP
jgi:hypothetical protein